MASQKKKEIIYMKPIKCNQLKKPYTVKSIVNSYCRKKHIRGGVAIYSHQSLNCTITKLDLNSLCDEQHFEVTGIIINSHKLIVVSMYRSPKGSINIFLEKMDMLLSELSNIKWLHYDIAIGGDLNADFDVTKCKGSVADLENLLRQYNLHHVNNRPTRNKACLDNIFVNFKTTENTCEVVVFPFSDHDSVSLNYESKIPLNRSNANRPVPTVVITRPITEDKIKTFRNSLADRDWFGHCSVDGHYTSSNDLPAKIIFDRFFNAFLTLFNHSIPIKKIKIMDSSHKSRSQNRQNIWYTKQLTDLKKQVLLLYNIYNSMKSDCAKSAYVECRNEYKKAILQAKKTYNANSMHNSTNKCKTAWKVINSAARDTKKDKINIPPQTLNEFFINSVREIGDTIIKPDISPSELLSQNWGRQSLNTSMVTFSEVSPRCVQGVIKQLKSSDSLDIYGISSNLLKKVCDCILYPLTHCISKCLLEGYFPDELKLSRIVPVYKKGDKDSPSSYRPIPIVPTFSKVIECIMYQQLSSHFENLGIINATQYGFRKNLSTIDAINMFPNCTHKYPIYSDRYHTYSNVLKWWLYMILWSKHELLVVKFSSEKERDGCTELRRHITFQ
ncbi:uncharacterized protein LOC124722820 [Schistocerca piceifrons]|uniref:uncharacterized protein LOC124722820 n=1 Tax=Schistocerca piceifrons TaxID=274613 RepID=UPI001F5EA7ED|nr:uncharacterized protein LOC124722820 [Schistocerca piceifrons]